MQKGALCMNGAEVSNNFVSNSFISFFETLLEAPTDIKRCLDTAGKAIEYLTEMIPIGKVEVKIEAPANWTILSKDQRRKVLYQKGEVARKANLYFDFETDVGGTNQFEIFAPIGYEYTEQEKKNLEFAMKQLYVFIGRARFAMMSRRFMNEDGLTGIPNLTTFYAHGNRLIEKGKIDKYDAIYFNVRNFKYINHMVDYRHGDQVMVQYAHQVCEFLIEDEMIARMGEDNYVAFIRRDRTEAFLKYLKEVMVEIETMAGKQKVNLSAVCGIYEIEKSVSMSYIMTAVSTAIQAAKQSYQKEYEYYTPELSKHILYEKKIAQEFVENMEDGKYITYLQPKFDMRNGSICGAEALARWKYKGKVIAPERFVPMLEQDGTVCMLDFEILRQACKLIESWKKRGTEPIQLSVNLSGWNLHSKTLVEDIMEILEEYQIEPKYIEIELPETLDYREYTTMMDLFIKLKENGLATALDDFRLGFSSLNLIEDLAVDVLKLDQQIVLELDGENRVQYQTMIEDVINMARRKNMKVLAQGVETTEQRDFLIQAGCDMAQGFLYATPMQIDEFERRIYR
jgi:diguanylate cyclase (GGDEF)-like protein